MPKRETEMGDRKSEVKDGMARKTRVIEGTGCGSDGRGARPGECCECYQFLLFKPQRGFVL